MSIKSLLQKLTCLGLILLSHFGLLSLTFGSEWTELFYHRRGTSLLLSALVIAVAYAGLSALFKHPSRNKESKFMVASLAVLGVAFLLYGVLFTKQQFQQIIASTVLFVGVAALAAFLDSRKESIGWRNFGRILTAGLLFSAAAFSYTYRHLIFYPKTPLTNSLEETKFKSRNHSLHTTFYGVDLTKYYVTDYRLPARISNVPSYISALDNKNFLLIGRYGNIYHLSLRKKEKNEPAEENLYIRKLSATFPINYRELYASETGKKITKSSFRVNDIYTGAENGKQVLYVGHHFYNVEKDCFTLRITKLAGDVSILLENKPSPEWRTLYETTPCFKLQKPKFVFTGHQAGGRIVGLDKDNLLFSVGDHEFDTHVLKKNFPQDPNASYGKIWKIHRHSGAAELVSTGHRNPQGLYHALDGSIWETEHGPEGGDELNRIKAGRNYGWPHVIYGASYGRHFWPPGIEQDGHAHYEKPVYAWTPSIGVSNLIKIEQDLFPLWKHDLLVSSLKRKTLFRLQMHGDRVIYSEPIRLNQRIRDLTETPNGEIFAWTDRQNLFRLRPESSLPRKNETLAQAGKRLSFKCVGCHGVKPNSPQGIGPNLHKVYGRRIAALADYNYSPALQAKASERWTRENLDLFLKDPGSFAPGTTMQIKIPDDHERRALLHYLENS